MRMSGIPEVLDESKGPFASRLAPTRESVHISTVGASLLAKTPDQTSQN
jgi:hypothetical protein